VDSDSLRGGEGDDTFFFGSDLLDDRSDLDVIADFESGDMFDFSEYIAAGGEVSFSSGAFEGRQAIDISLSGEDTVKVLGNLGAAQFQLTLMV
ncbi:MAG: hypothetical protein WBG66_13670, partial [Geitlerinemataceae cyanobacterium]